MPVLRPRTDRPSPSCDSSLGEDLLTAGKLLWPANGWTRSRLSGSCRVVSLVASSS